MNREEIQNEALLALKNNNGNGTIAMEVGTGKSKVAIDFIRDLNRKNILITSPRTNLKANWQEQLNTWKFNNNVSMANIQTTYKWTKEQLSEFDQIIVDEVHLAITPEYSRLIAKAKELNIPIIGLTGTPELHKKDKREFYSKYIPIIFEFYNSAKEGIVNKSRYIIFEHELSHKVLVKAGSKKKRFTTTELYQYEYLTKNLKRTQNTMMRLGSDNWFDDAREWGWNKKGSKEEIQAGIRYLNAINMRKNFLWNLPSTIKLVKDIKNLILLDSKNKVLIFSELTKQVDKLTNYTVHSNNVEEINNKRIEAFNKGVIRELGSVRSLQLGLNLKKANWAIFESYNGSRTSGKQNQGRLQRLDSNSIANIIIIKVLNTQYETWFDNYTKMFDMSNSVTVNSIDNLRKII